ncbi:efflux RND transporter permease subunit [bacterium]|nr:efflux RND transporter permease subunit [bacterium]
MTVFRTIIQRKTLVSMFFIACVLLGYISYKQLPVELLPNAELPYLFVTVSATRELEPEYIEKQVLIPVEAAISTLEGIDMIESSADSQRGTIYVYYNQNVKIKYAYLKLQEKINELASTLPEEIRIRVVKVDTVRLSNTFMSLQARGSGGIERVRAVVDEKIVPKLTAVDGIANVDVVGGTVKAVEILLNEEACRELKITPARVRSLISQNNEQKMYVGPVYENGRILSVNVFAEYTDVRDLEDIIVVPEGPVRLKDIAEINFGGKQETSISRVNGKEAISLQLVRDTQTNLIELSHSAKSVISNLNKELKSQDVEIVIQSNSADDIEDNINLIKKLAITGGLLAVLILWFFLKNLKLVTVILLAIPISVFTAFNFFYAYNISINSLTLIGIALAVGMLLDNSVVVLENIYRLISKHVDSDTAVVQGTSEVWRAIVAATLTTIIVFVPFLFSSDYLVQLIGRHIGVSIISTLLVSLLIAMTLVPNVTHMFLTRRKSDKGFVFNKISQRNRLLQIYNLLLKSAIRFPVRTILGAVIMFFTTLLLCIMFSKDVPSEIELKQFSLYVTMAQGSTLEMTDTVVKELEGKFTDIEEIQDVICTVYEAEANITIMLKDNFEDIKHRSIAQIKQDIQKRIENFRAADVSLSEPRSSSRFGGGMSRNPMSSFERMFGIGTPQEKVILKGSDFYMLRTVADDIIYYLNNLDSINNGARSNIPGDRPEIHLYLDNQTLSIYNITKNSLASELASFGNESSSDVKFKQGNEEYDIVIRNGETETDKSVDDLKVLRVPDQSGNEYDLQDISRVVYATGKSTIKRINQEKQVEITYSFIDEINDSKTLLQVSRDEISELIAGLSIPPGIAVEVTHDETSLNEFYFLIAAAFILIYMILASVFESLTTPLVMMFTIPLAAVGAFWALIFTGNSIYNANSLIGLLILLGVVVNNGIILIDYTRILRTRRFSRFRALMMAGQARVRPILITAITTIVAMVPLAMGSTERVSRIGAPFAITVIGGLSLSTIFTLVFIPTVYSGMESLLGWIRGLNWKIKVLQLAACIGGAFFIYTAINSIIWKFADFFVLLMAIPGATYFLMLNLRRAKTEYIQSDRPLTIKARRVVKIYDDYSRFVREWKKGERLNNLYGIAKDNRSWKDFGNYQWQLLLLGFMIYFTYFYIEDHLWLFILSHFVYFAVLFLLTPVRILLANFAEKTGKQGYAKGAAWLHSIVLLGIPAGNIILFHFREFKLPTIIFITILWYSALIVYITSNRLHRGRVNIMRLTGRFADVRKTFYRIVQAIPIIGRKKRPFNALDGVSFEIKSGMFGLLGPNGAGKTTIMRIICGIFHQSLGTITVNDIDFTEKREELQGLIGYLPQEFGTYENMTAYEFLDYIAILKNIYDKEKRDSIVQYVISSVHLDEHKNQKIGSFSGGMKQRMGIALTLLHLPRILVVDEPTAGLDPRERIRFRNLLVDLSKERIVIFSTHIIEDISSSCNNVAVLNKGRVFYLGSPSNMIQLAQEKVWQFDVTETEFQRLRTKLRIIHHMSYENTIRVRCLADSEPYAGAKHVQPTLEDAYLWLLGENVTAT